MLNYADCLSEGIGGPADPQQAKEYYEKAVALGVPNALEHLQKLSRRGSLGGVSLIRNRQDDG
jgi:TPR repeat protein